MPAAEPVKGPDKKGILATLRKARENHGVAFEDQSHDELINAGFLTLSTIMGGGPRRGRIVEVFGNEGTGKTTLVVQIVGANMRPGEVALFLDYEHTFQPEWVTRYTGFPVVHMSRSETWFKSQGDTPPPVIIWAQPEHLEDGVGLSDDLVEGFGPRLRHVIFDSVAMMTPKAQQEAGPEDSLPAIRARKLGWWLEPAVGKYHRNGTNIWFPNQVREKIGAMGYSELAKIQTPGGRAIKFNATHRLYVGATSNRKWIGVLGENSYAAEITCVKNKVNPTRRGKTRLTLFPGLGFSPDIELIDLAEEKGVLQPAGPGKFTFDGRSVSRLGLVKALLTPATSGPLRDMLTDRVRAKFKDDPVSFKEYEQRDVPLDIDELIESGAMPPPTAFTGPTPQASVQFTPLVSPDPSFPRE